MIKKKSLLEAYEATNDLRELINEKAMRGTFRDVSTTRLHIFELHQDLEHLLVEEDVLESNENLKNMEKELRTDFEQGIIDKDKYDLFFMEATSYLFELGEALLEEERLQKLEAEGGQAVRT